MFVMAGIADIVSGIVQIGGGFEQPAVMRRQPVGVLKAEKQIVREAGHFAGVAQGDAEVFGHFLHHAPLIDGKLASARGRCRASARSAMMPSRTPAAE